MQEERLTRECRFRTDRLDVAEWHNVGLRDGDELIDVVKTFLTSTTTRSLPSVWQGDYDEARAAGWIRERDEESVTLMVTDRETGIPVGLVILFESAADDHPATIDVRLGYLFAESAWGRGLATEVVAGFVGWCLTTRQVRSIVGGVEHGNTASARVLIKNGFTPFDSTNNADQFYELVLAADRG